MQLVALRSKPGLRGPGRSPSNSDLLLRHPSLLSCLRTTTTQHWKYNCIWAPYSIKQLKMTFSRLSLSTICDDNAGCYGVSIFGVEVYRAGREMVKIGVGQKGEGRAGQAKAEPWSTYYCAWQTQLDPIRHPKWLRIKVLKSCNIAENCCMTHLRRWFWSKRSTWWIWCKMWIFENMSEQNFSHTKMMTLLLFHWSSTAF